ncbi:hypothetical protein HPO96_30805 [Kribbella sandramycini]|uniref:GerMN domain-containing protein n=1 Tax=Kribbella sandramycini TaxID=60450 RepID=A0A7Y4L5C9_9ACTN|nr:hypothetical protein [Kribbella sandramycini]MBB6566925.1 hypothetical protein [Kribbella sandramycini]NOL44647.1 hypothetical protein [Kribbella sandramycini]
MVLAAALACSLAACGGTDASSGDLPTLTPEPITSTSPTSTPSTTPTPTADPTQVVTKYKDLTLVFNQPANVAVETRPALKAYKLFQQAFRRTLGTNTFDPSLKTIAAPAVLDYVQKVLKNQTKDGDRLGGTLTVTATVEEAKTGIVLIGGCFDQSKSYGIHSDGTRFGNDLVKRKPRLGIQAITIRSAAGWRVSEYKLQSTPC